MIPRLTAISIKTNWYKVIEGLYAIAKCLHVAVTQRNPRRRTNRLAQFLAWPRIRAPRERERERERERGFFFDTKAGRGCEGVEMKEAGTGGTE
jgi:hypothetical protein